MNRASKEISGFAKAEPRHQCLIYDGAPSQQLPALAATIKQKLRENYRCLYLNSRPMVAGIRSSLAAMDVDVVNEVAHARLILSSDSVAAIEGRFIADEMLLKIEETLDHALQDGYSGLWASGDMSWEFGQIKDVAMLMDYEYRLEQIFARRPELCGICQYHCATLPPDVTRSALLTHQSLYINETLSRINPIYAPTRPSLGHLTDNSRLDEMISALRRESVAGGVNHASSERLTILE